MGEHLNPKRAADMRKLSGTVAKTLTGMFIGHGNLAYHRHKQGLQKVRFADYMWRTTKLLPMYYAIVPRLGTNAKLSPGTSS